MFVGHYGVAFAVKTERNKIPLWVLFVAVQFLDYIWAIFILLGIEKLRVVRGLTAGSMLDAYYMPFSHSLIAAYIWSGIAFAVYKAAWRARASNSAALLVALAVFSFFFNDTATTEIYTLPLHDALTVSTSSSRMPVSAPTAPSSSSRPTSSRSEEHTSELQSRENLVCRLLLEKKKKISRTRVGPAKQLNQWH